jgi:hypothetical protein
MTFGASVGTLVGAMELMVGIVGDATGLAVATRQADCWTALQEGWVAEQLVAAVAPQHEYEADPAHDEHEVVSKFAGTIGAVPEPHTTDRLPDPELYSPALQELSTFTGYWAQL